MSGWLGSMRQVSGSQDSAKDLISESLTLFASLGETIRTAEAEIELAWCYLREGSFDEARVTLQLAVENLPDSESELKGLALVRSASVERSAERYRDELPYLLKAAPLIEACESHALKGKYHLALAGTWESLGVIENRTDYIDRALIELAAASFHFEQAGHIHHRARVENNLGFSLFRAGRFSEAYEHLARARQLFVSLKDGVRAAQVDETRSRALLAEGRHAEAERIARAAVRALERGDEQSLLAETLITYGIALARLKRQAQARDALQRAVVINEQLNNREGTGCALLTLFEELAHDCMPDELQAIYLRADELLSQTQQADLLSRLRGCARRLVAGTAINSQPKTSNLRFVHESEATANLLREAQAIAKGEGAVLLSGETGTGKEVLARLIHEWSGRRGRFVAINCATLCDALVESQLFGHKKGSFTDAQEDYAGVVREAEAGTLFLDEVGELSLTHQAKLLRLIDLGEMYPVGSSVPEQMNVRIIAATNHDLGQRVGCELFRPDLFYRLNAFHFRLPPLRERPEDVPALARHFIAEAQRQYRKQITFTPESLKAMTSLALRGNARELRTLIERTYITAQEGVVITAEAVEIIALRQIPPANLAAVWSGCSLEDEVRAYERNLIRRALDSAGGSITRAARLLNATHQGLAYIVNGRHKDLLSMRRPARRRRVSLMRPDDKVKR
ncbi:MAG: sigma 54-interacting transcriptional regulator [Pyrinomonadaceae bacterium]